MSVFKRNDVLLFAFNFLSNFRFNARFMRWTVFNFLKFKSVHIVLKAFWLKCDVHELYNCCCWISNYIYVYDLLLKRSNDVWEELGHPNWNWLQLYESTIEGRLFKYKHTPEITQSIKKLLSINIYYLFQIENTVVLNHGSII